MELIVAVDANWGIGKNGDQLFYLREDLKNFRLKTVGKTIILGRKTLATFPNGQPLKGRENVVLSRQAGLKIPGAKFFTSVEDVLSAVPDDSIVVGGGMVYAAFLPHCDKAYVTHIHAACDADTFFPNLSESDEWELLEESAPIQENGTEYHFATYVRKK